MKNNKQVVRSLFGYLAAVFAVILIISIHGVALAEMQEIDGPAAPAGSGTGIAATVGASLGGGLGGFAFSLSAGDLSGGGSGGIASSLCNIVSWFTEGGIGAAVASLAVIFMGIAAFFGKVTWGMAIVTAASIFAIFGAGEIVNAIVGGNVTASCGNLGGSGLDVTAALAS